MDVPGNKKAKPQTRLPLGVLVASIVHASLIKCCQNLYFSAQFIVGDQRRAIYWIPYGSTFTATFPQKQCPIMSSATKYMTMHFCVAIRSCGISSWCFWKKKNEPYDIWHMPCLVLEVLERMPKASNIVLERKSALQLLRTGWRNIRTISEAHGQTTAFPAAVHQKLSPIMSCYASISWCFRQAHAPEMTSDIINARQSALQEMRMVPKIYNSMQCFFQVLKKMINLLTPIRKYFSSSIASKTRSG